MRSENSGSDGEDLGNHWVGPKVLSVFSVLQLQERIVVFNVIQNNLVRLYCDSCHIRVHLQTLKLVNFCAAILTWKMEKDTQHFWREVSGRCTYIVARHSFNQLGSTSPGSWI